MSAPLAAQNVAVAIDIGATMLKAALIQRDGTLLSSMRTPTPASPEEAAIAVQDAISRLTCEAGIDSDTVAGIGVSIAAFVSAEGRIVATAHLGQEWVNDAFGDRLRAKRPGNYYFALDAPAPTLGEAYYGAGRGHADFAYVTVSTGVGAGLFLDGAIYTGGLGWAGGMGHVIVDPAGTRTCTGCGNRGCLETFAATQGILALARKAIERNPASLLAEVGIDDLTPRAVCDAAAAGDAAAIGVFSEAGRYLGLGLASLVNMLSVTRIVVGGGIALAGDLLLEPARQVVRRAAFPPAHRSVRIVPAELGDLSGSYGAAAMVFNDIRINIEKGS